MKGLLFVVQRPQTYSQIHDFGLPVKVSLLLFKASGFILVAKIGKTNGKKRKENQTERELSLHMSAKAFHKNCSVNTV